MFGLDLAEQMCTVTPHSFASIMLSNTDSYALSDMPNQNDITRRIITADDERTAARCAVGHVVVIDDDPQILVALCELLQVEGYDCESYPSATAYLHALSFKRPNFAGPRCVLCDVKLPDMDGLQLQRRLAESDHTPILLMSGDSGASEAVSAFRSGAVDFLIKPLDVDVLLQSIAKALSLSSDRQQGERRNTYVTRRIESLTPREREIASYVAGGSTNQEIAEQLNIALRTVKLHRHRAKEKMGVDTLVDMVRLADEGGL
jgi:FixJ family two-component response regulator